MSIASRKLKVGDFALTDFNETGTLTRVKIIDRKNSISQSGVLFRVEPSLKNGSADSWYDADWFIPDALNDEAERNALLAVIAQKDEALQIFTEPDKHGYTVEFYYENDLEVLAKQALALTPNNVRLVEVGMARRVDGSSLLTMDSFDADKVPAGTKLYTIEKGE